MLTEQCSSATHHKRASAPHFGAISATLTQTNPDQGALKTDSAVHAILHLTILAGKDHTRFLRPSKLGTRDDIIRVMPRPRRPRPFIGTKSRRILNWVRDERSLSRASGRRSIYVADVFSGCGGLSFGVAAAARDLGLRPRVVAAFEKDVDASRVYLQNLPCEKDALFNEDVAQLFQWDLRESLSRVERQLASRIGKVDLLISGPPCQGHSDLNNSTRRDDPRNLLYLAPIRLAQMLRPQLVLIENVPTVIHSRQRVVDRAICALEEMGYEVSSSVHSAADFGIPQRRRRHVLVGVLAGPVPQVGSQDPPSPVWDVIHDLEEESTLSHGIFRTPSRMSPENQRRAAYLFRRDMFDLPNSMRPKCHQSGHSYKSCYGRIFPDRPSQTITSGFGCMGQGRYLHPYAARTITPHEAARIQSFPDSFVFDDVQSRRHLATMIGNAVPPYMAYRIAQSILSGTRN